VERGAQPWWQRAVIYQVYPRSFADSDGDGVGDLPGIAGRLRHLAWLGVDAVWLSPIYASPMADFGYDISDHTAIDPLFGTLADFDALLAEAHRLGLRLVLDYVPNHTSSEHPWFEDARVSRTAARREWYLWRDSPPDGGAPNNWRSVFGGPAWTLDPRTSQHYYHAYLAEQPDLNWRHPSVREAMLNVLRFWLDRGVDGFRVDALRQLLKDSSWRDNPPNPAFRPGMPPYEELLPVYSADVDDVHEAIAEMRRVVSGHGAPSDERLLIGELYLPIERLVRYYGADGAGVQMPTNMHLLAVDWDAGAIADLVERYESDLPPGAWPNWVLGNHDRSRIATRIGRAQARVAAMLLLTLRGTPTIYYGDELGMSDAVIATERVRDPYEHLTPGLGVGRDRARTPMQWTAEPGAGFCPPNVLPWLPTGEDSATINVASQRADASSMLALYRRLIELRRRSDALRTGPYRTVSSDQGVLVYARDDADETVTVALNLTARPRTLPWPRDAVVLLSTQLDREGQGVGAELRLRPNEGVVLSVRNTGSGA
jgi:alpha-glucosidase